ncbi:MAG TPA: hypothetical protein VH878_10080 [Thermodesulfobacteriota bacterium]
MNTSSKERTYVTGSKYLDLFIFAILLSVILVSSYRLRVYYQFIYSKVNLVRIDTGGERINIPVPNYIQSYGLATLQPQIMWGLAEKLTRNYLKKYLESYKVKDITQFDWIVTYSYNSFKLDRERIITFDADGKSLNR